MMVTGRRREAGMMERKRRHDEGGAPSYRLDEAADQTAPQYTDGRNVSAREGREKMKNCP